MSTYTTQVRFICENFAGFNDAHGYENVDEIIDKAIPHIFSFDFPIFDEEYRKVLCTKILKYYYTREICCETVGRWKLFLDEKLNRIMPKYNKLYLSEQMAYDPLRDVDITTEHTGTGTNTETNTMKTDTGSTSRTNTDNNTDETISDNNVDRYSDTPQGSLVDMRADKYLTHAELIDSTRTRGTHQVVSSTVTGEIGSTTNENKQGNTTDNYVTRYFGKSAGKTYASLITEYRNTLINIDDMIIKELSDLFMNIW